MAPKLPGEVTLVRVAEAERHVRKVGIVTPQVIGGFEHPAVADELAYRQTRLSPEDAGQLLTRHSDLV